MWFWFVAVVSFVGVSSVGVAAEPSRVVSVTSSAGVAWRAEGDACAFFFARPKVALSCWAHNLLNGGGVHGGHGPRPWVRAVARVPSVVSLVEKRN